MSEQTQELLSEVIPTLGIQMRTHCVNFGDWNPKNTGFRFHWRVILLLDGQQMNVDYYMGSAHVENGTPKRPDVTEVVWSLLLDGGALDETFEEWCSEFGMIENHDSISELAKARATYEACCEYGEGLKELLGSETFARLRNCENDI